MTVIKTLIEKVNQNACDYVASLTFKEYFIKFPNEKDFEKTTDKQYFNQVKKYLKLQQQNNYKKKVNYSYSKEENCGRLYADCGLQNLGGNLRKFLTQGIYRDYDMVSCHPNLMLNMCKDKNLSCLNLENYCNNRGDFLTKNKVDKFTMLKFFNQDGPKIKLYSHEVIKLVQEVNENKRALFEEFKTTIIFNTEKENPISSCINKVWCDEENKLLQNALLNFNDFDSGILMFDGFMAEFDIDVSNLNCEKMKWSEKENKSDVKIPENYKDEKKIIGVKSDKDAADTIYKLYPHWVFCEEKLHVFDEDTGLWESNTVSYFKILKKYEKELTFILVRDENIILTQKSYGNTLTLMKTIVLLIPDLCRNENWLIQSQKSSIGKLLFPNGIYDGHKGLFYPKDDYGFDPKIVFFGKMYKNFEPFTEIDMTEIDQIKNTYFYESLGVAQGDFLATHLARGLFGDEMKKILFGLGGTNTGKSTISKALKLSLGDYFGTFNAENLAVSKSSNDEAQRMRWVMLLKNKRIIVSNELKPSSELDETMVKKVTGGDSVTARHHGGNEHDFLCHFFPISFANDFPKIRTYDDAIKERLRIVHYKKQFVNGEPQNEFELKKNPKMEDDMKTERFQRLFVGLLLREYMVFKEEGEKEDPEEVCRAKNEWVQEKTDFIDEFLEEFELTNNENDYVLSSKIQDWLESQKTGVSIKKFTIELKKHCVIKKFDKIESIKKKIQGKTPQIWIGIKENFGGGSDDQNSIN